LHAGAGAGDGGCALVLPFRTENLLNSKKMAKGKSFTLICTHAESVKIKI